MVLYLGKASTHVTFSICHKVGAAGTLTCHRRRHVSSYDGWRHGVRWILTENVGYIPNEIAIS